MLQMQSAGCLVNSVLSSCEAPVCRTLSFPVQSLESLRLCLSLPLHLDNSDHQLAIDYDQVTVSRRLYRSGESEYMINGSTCRLKDINELFYDTGIGKEGYSIIGQGQIDKILSGKPEDRRELFDEAAGIVKYKRRKSMPENRG